MGPPFARHESSPFEQAAALRVRVSVIRMRGGSYFFFSIAHLLESVFQQTIGPPLARQESSVFEQAAARPTSTSVMRMRGGS